MQAPIHKALILAAGKGKRMGDLTKHVPKPMLPVSGKPVLEHGLDRLREAGIDSACLVTGYYGEQIQAHFQSYPMHLEYRVQERLTGTVTAALLGREFCGADPFLLTFGDILCGVEDYRALMETMEPGVAAVLGVKWVEDPSAGAAVYEDNGSVVRIVEKPRPGTSATHWNSAGVYIFTPEIFAQMAAAPLSIRGEYEITTAIANLIARGRLVKTYTICGAWMDVGRPEDLARARELLRANSLNANA